MLHKRLNQQKYAGLAVLLVAANTSLAADRSVQPFVYAREQFNTNLLLQRNSPDIWNTTAGGGLRLRLREENWGVRGNVRLESRLYHGEDQLDTDNQYFDGTSFYRTERSRFGLDAYYFRDSTIVTGDPFGIADIGAGDGDVVDDPAADDPDELAEQDFVGVANRRERIRIRPSWTYALTERTDVGALYSFRDVFHDKAAESGRINYHTQETESFLTHMLTEQTGITPAFSYLSYQEAEAPFGADVYTGTLSLFTSFSRTLKGSLGLGARYVSASGRPSDRELAANPTLTARDGDDTDIVVNALLTQRFEHTRLSAKYIKDVYVTGTSGLVDRNQVSLRLRQDFSETLDGLLELIFLNQETLFSSNVNRQRESDSYRAHARVRWWMTDDFNVALAYRYTLRDRSLGAFDADSHAAFLTLEYNLPEVNF